MAEVFLAMQRGPAGFQKLIVIKRLRAGMGNDPHFERLFLNEARLAARLNHPNVVQTFEVGVDGSVHFIAMEYLAGQPVNKLLSHAARNPDAFPLAVRLQLISDCLAGLDYAHSLADFDGRPLGIVHRDISPHNVFVTYDGVTKVVDFGIAKTTESPQFAEMSTTGALKGKIRYMAPEQLRGERLDRRADVFSMGVMLWEAVANGGRMWQDEDDITVIMSLSDGITRPPEAADPNIDPQLAQVLRRALAGSVDERYRTAEAFRIDLDRYLARIGGPISAREIGAYVQAAFEGDRRKLDSAVRDAIDDAEAELDNAMTVLRSRETIEAAMAAAGHSSDALNALFRRPSAEHNASIPRIEHSTSAVVVAPTLLGEIPDEPRSGAAAAAIAPKPKASPVLVGVAALLVVFLGIAAVVKLRPAPDGAPTAAAALGAPTPPAAPASAEPAPATVAVPVTTAAETAEPPASAAPAAPAASSAGPSRWSAAVPPAPAAAGPTPTASVRTPKPPPSEDGEVRPAKGTKPAPPKDAPPPPSDVSPLHL